MKVGYGTVIHPLSNIYCKEIGNNCTIANFVEIGKDVVIGNHCSIQAFAFIPQGVTLGDNVFVGPHVCFTNCKYPSANKKYCCVTHDGMMLEKDYINLQDCKAFAMDKTIVEDDVVIGAGSVIMCGITIGKGAIIGAGTLVLNDVPAHTTITQERKTIVNFR